MRVTKINKIKVKTPESKVKCKDRDTKFAPPSRKVHNEELLMQERPVTKYGSYV